MIAVSTYTYSGDGSPAVPEIGDWRHGGDWSTIHNWSHGDLSYTVFVLM